MADSRLRPVSLGAAMFLTACATGMGWGIRGQFGHETGAMIAGVLGASTLLLLLRPLGPTLPAARAAAMMTVGIGIGGSMTYGQTIGLTQDAQLIGNWDALRWGMLGLGIKGGIWIGFGGGFFGMGLSGKRYSAGELFLLMSGLLLLMLLGTRVINGPYDPANQILPRVYFSADWHFQPNAAELKPRREVWGGLLVALTALAIYTRYVRGDRLPVRLIGYGFLGGFLGFPGGQTIQAFHAWNAELFTTGALSTGADLFRLVNWWNMMEITFGAIFGAVLACGVWRQQALIDLASERPVSLSVLAEMALLTLHLILLVATEFLEPPGAAAWLGWYGDYGLLLAAIPMIGCACGRIWPFAVMSLVTAVPIAGKSLRQLAFETEQFSHDGGWLAIVALPIGLCVVLCSVWIDRQSRGVSTAIGWAASSLLLAILLYFGLNTLFFEYAWPWQAWTGRTPSQLLFTGASCILAVTAVQASRRSAS